jgi:hypothetical protein
MAPDADEQKYNITGFDSEWGLPPANLARKAQQPGVSVG